MLALVALLPLGEAEVVRRQVQVQIAPNGTLSAPQQLAQNHDDSRCRDSYVPSWANGKSSAQACGEWYNAGWGARASGSIREACYKDGWGKNNCCSTCKRSAPPGVCRDTFKTWCSQVSTEDCHVGFVKELCCATCERLQGPFPELQAEEPSCRDTFEMWWSTSPKKNCKIWAKGKARRNKNLMRACARKKECCQTCRKALAAAAEEAAAPKAAPQVPAGCEDTYHGSFGLTCPRWLDANKKCNAWAKMKCCKTCVLAGQA